jgi:hypothetical protein
MARAAGRAAALGAGAATGAGGPGAWRRSSAGWAAGPGTAATVGGAGWGTPSAGPPPLAAVSATPGGSGAATAGGTARGAAATRCDVGGGEGAPSPLGASARSGGRAASRGGPGGLCVVSGSSRGCWPTRGPPVLAGVGHGIAAGTGASPPVMAGAGGGIATVGNAAGAAPSSSAPPMGASSGVAGASPRRNRGIPASAPSGRSAWLSAEGLPSVADASWFGLRRRRGGLRVRVLSIAVPQSPWPRSGGRGWLHLRNSAARARRSSTMVMAWPASRASTAAANTALRIAPPGRSTAPASRLS